MADAYESTQAAADRSVQPSAADAVTEPIMAPMHDAAGDPMTGKEESAEEAAAQLSDFA